MSRRDLEKAREEIIRTFREIRELLLRKVRA